LGIHYLNVHCGIIHTDLKPENVMICLDKDELKEIYDEGMIKKNKEMANNIEAIRKRVKELNGEKYERK
jgi:serine/threonine protein kinase